MADIKKREEKMQARRKQTPFRDFVKEIASRMPANIYKQDIGLSRYPKSDRQGILLDVKVYEESGVNVMCDV